MVMLNAAQLGQRAVQDEGREEDRGVSPNARQMHMAHLVIDALPRTAVGEFAPARFFDARQDDSVRGAVALAGLVLDTVLRVELASPPGGLLLKLPDAPVVRHDQAQHSGIQLI